MSGAEALRPLWVKITGPLIRIAADKLPWAVKAAILQTLSQIIARGGAALRPFQPQLQTTCVGEEESTRALPTSSPSIPFLPLPPLLQLRQGAV